MVTEDCSKEIPVIGERTVTVQEAAISSWLAVMVAVPAPTAVTTPPDTEATAVLSLLQDMYGCSVVLEGATAALKEALVPRLSVRAVWLMETAVTGIITVI